jgi:hypothetical protein
MAITGDEEVAGSTGSPAGNRFRRARPALHMKDFVEFCVNARWNMKSAV